VAVARHCSADRLVSVCWITASP